MYLRTGRILWNSNPNPNFFLNSIKNINYYTRPTNLPLTIINFCHESLSRPVEIVQKHLNNYQGHKPVVYFDGKSRHLQSILSLSGTPSWPTAQYPVVASLLQVYYSACGALKNISYGKDPDNKIAIMNCDGVPALIRLLRKTRSQDLTDTITG